MPVITPKKLADMPKRKLIKPKPILPNMMTGHWRHYENGKSVWISGYFRKPRRKNDVKHTIN